MPVSLEWTLFILIAYLSGGVEYSRLLPRLICHVDVQEQSDDGNPGGANAVKLAGWGVGLCCIFLDIAKGFVPTWVALRLMGDGGIWTALLMTAPVLGHATDPFRLRRRRGTDAITRLFAGGKAISCSFGVLAALLPRNYSFFILAALYIFFSVAVKIDPNRVRSIVTYGLLALLGGTYSALIGMYSVAAGIVGVCAVVMLKHTRLFLLDENKDTAAEADAEAEAEAEEV